MIFIDIIIPYFSFDCNEKRGKQIEKTDIFVRLISKDAFGHLFEKVLAETPASLRSLVLLLRRKTSTAGFALRSG